MDKIRDRLWSVQDVADYLGIPPRTLYNWRCRGIGPRVLRGVVSADECGVVSADGVGREDPAGRGRGGVFVGVVPVVVGMVPVCQSMTSVTAERAALSSTRFLPPANAATRDCSAMLLTARG